MIGNISPQGGHDHLEVAELEKVQLDTNAFLQAKFSSDVVDLRAKFIQKLLRHDALHDGFGFAMFDIVEPEAGNLLTDEQPKDLMVLLRRATHIPTDPPTIRIVTNETFEQERSFVILTQDITVDHEGDIQYFADALEVSEGLLQDTVETREVMDGTVSGGKCTSPFFMVSPDMKIVMSNVMPYTPAYSVSEIGLAGEVVEIMPYGTYETLEDKIYGLSVANELFDEIKDKEPKVRATE